jgi:ketosteroid isomerase-like protein
MSQENVEIAKAAASAMRDGGPWTQFVTTDYTWDMSTAPGMWPEEQTHTGVEAVGRFFRGWLETFDEWTYSVEEEIDCGEQVIFVVHERARIKGTDADVDGHWAYLWTLRDGKVSKTEVFFTKEEALQAAGLRE